MAFDCLFNISEEQVVCVCSSYLAIVCLSSMRFMVSCISRLCSSVQGEPGSFGMMGLPGPPGRGLPGSKVSGIHTGACKQLRTHTHSNPETACISVAPTT